MLGVDCQTAFNKFTRGEGDRTPVFEGSKGVVGDQDGLHFFKIGVSVEGGIAAEEEVGYYADCPDVSKANIRSEKDED